MISLDIKLGVRMLMRYPGLGLAGGFGIAVAVALAVAGFSVMQRNFEVSSLPGVVSMEVWDPAASKPERRILRDYHVWREELESIEEISAFRTLTPNLIARGVQTASIRVASISATGFNVAGVQPLMGRYLAADDEREGAPGVAVIGAGIWRNRFASDPAILGRTIELGTTPYSIVGVMPEGFAFPVNHFLWVPLRPGLAPSEPLTGPDLMVFGRLAPGATLSSAQSELATIGRRMAATFPKQYSPLRPRVMPYPYPFLGMHGIDDINGVYAMQGAVTLLLVVICLNVAILVYTRTAMRQGEIALRTALGANRGRIVAQLFIEALVLSGAAALAGVGIAALALRQVHAATLPIATELPYWMSFRLSPQAALYAGGLSVLAAAIVGIVPALQATGSPVRSGMRLGTTWTILIVAQVGGAVALLPAAVFNAWDGMRNGMAEPGFAAAEYLSAQLENTDRQTELRRRLEAEPWVSGVTFAMTHPGDEPGESIETEMGTSAHAVRFNRVAINFFRTFDVPILAGRGFERDDVSEGGTVLVNQPLAERIFGGNALGRRIRYSGTRWYEIAGIVPDFPTGASPGMRDTTLKVYHASAVGQALAIRMRNGSAATFTRRLQEIATGVDPGLELRNVSSLDQVLRREQWILRLEASVFAAVTVSVLMLSSAGIYALMSFTVSQRRKEIAIRTALGADRKRIVAGIFSRALGQLAVGAGLGMVSGALIEHASGGNFMQGNAVVVLPGVGLLMMAVGFLATLAPARRSLRIAPTEALREQ